MLRKKPMTCPPAIRISWSHQCDAPILLRFRRTEPELAFALVSRVDAFIVLMNNELNNERAKSDYVSFSGRPISRDVSYFSLRSFLSRSTRTPTATTSWVSYRPSFGRLSGWRDGGCFVRSIFQLSRRRRRRRSRLFSFSSSPFYALMMLLATRRVYAR